MVLASFETMIIICLYIADCIFIDKYTYHDTKMIWTDAQEYCQDTFGTDLASVHSDQDMDIITTLSNGLRVWIGLNDIDEEGTFIWTDGSPFDYAIWKPGEPNNYDSGHGVFDDCGEIWTSIMSWNDRYCTATRYFLCNIHPPTSSPTMQPTTDPTIDPTQDPTTDPSVDPTQDPTKDPTTDPTGDPSPYPTADPTKDPTNVPTSNPTVNPTQDPTQDPTIDPSVDPTSDPTTNPSKQPTEDPTNHPSMDPTDGPTADPSNKPTQPTGYPTSRPTLKDSGSTGNAWQNRPWVPHAGGQDDGSFTNSLK